MSQNGKPLQHVLVLLKVPVKVHGRWVYRLLGKAYTNSGGKFDIVVDHAPPHTYFVAWVDHHAVLKRYVYVKPNEAVAFDMAVTTGFAVAGVQTFVY